MPAFHFPRLPVSRLLPNLPRRAKLGQRKPGPGSGTSVARDGQGLEVSNAGVEAIAALDFLNDEWLGFGNRLAVFMAAADKDERCAMLPVMAANLMLSMNSADGHATAKRYLARAQELASDANPRERAWIAATEAWVAGETDRSLAIHEDMANRVAARSSGRQARPAPCLQPRRLRGAAAHRRAPVRGQPRQPLRLRHVCVRPGGVQSHRRGRSHGAPGPRHGPPRSLGAPRHRPLPGGARQDDWRAWPSWNWWPTPGRAATPSCTPTIGGTWRSS